MTPGTTPACAPGKIAQVVLDIPQAGHFDFAAPDIRPGDVGRMAVVPMGASRRAGLIVGIADSSQVEPSKLRALLHIQRAWPALGERDLALLRFCAGYYHAPLGVVALAACPPAMRTTRAVHLDPDFLVSLTAAGVRAAGSLPRHAARLRGVVKALAEGPRPESLLRARQSHAAASIRALVERGWVSRNVFDPAQDHASRRLQVAAGPTLNADQQAAFDAVRSALGQSHACLLDGITGSGKTEVYLRLVAETLQRGSQALILLPEINLTPQFLQRIGARFPDARIGVQHSGMADGARLKGYLDAQSGVADVVIGTRLAVFTPMPRLGLIVVDEEHDASFKQETGLRYSARDLAMVRAREAGCPIVLGSATPSLETLANVERGRVQRLVLRARANPQAALPAIAFIDVSTGRLDDGLSSRLASAIAETLARREQALVFINRRGFAPALVCGQCGHIPGCTRCSAKLVLHRRDARLKCHHCGWAVRVPTACAECGSAELVAAGQGTERIEAALQRLFPDARIARVDRDSTRRKGSAEAIFDAAGAGTVDILVGTQMLSKGHDLARITLVAVLNADGAMFAADFRAAERMVAQLMQVAGRAGRAEFPGRVLIQTRFPEHPLYQAIAAQDHAAFAQGALAERRLTRMPPFSHLALLSAESRDPIALAAFVHEAFARAGVGAIEGVQVWDPVPAPLAKKAGYHRMQILLQSASRRALQSFLDRWLGTVAEVAARRVNWSIDVDPSSV